MKLLKGHQIKGDLLVLTLNFPARKNAIYEEHTISSIFMYSILGLENETKIEVETEN